MGSETQCPSCKVHPHKQACSWNCERARITEAVKGERERCVTEALAQTDKGEDEGSTPQTRLAWQMACVNVARVIKQSRKGMSNGTTEPSAAAHLASQLGCAPGQVGEVATSPECVNCSEAIYQPLDLINSGFWYHARTGSAVCCGLSANPTTKG